MVEECAKVRFVTMMLVEKEAASREALKRKLLSGKENIDLEAIKRKFGVSRI